MISNIHFIDAGYTVHPEFSVMKTGKFKKIPFPARVCVIEHSQLGVILFDTGYSVKFHEYTKNFPEKIYSLITPVFISIENTAVMKLKEIGIHAHDVKYIIISHFHADHIGGLCDFPNARYIYSEDAKRTILTKGRLKKTLQGFIPQFLPQNFSSQSLVLEAKKIIRHSCQLGYFKFGWDIFDDGSIFAIPLPGHAPGHMGIYFRVNEKEYFLISDAAWLTKALQANLKPSFWASLIFDSKVEYDNTFSQLHNLVNEKENNNFVVVPCHCSSFKI